MYASTCAPAARRATLVISTARSSQSISATAAPASTRISAVARPIPLPPPVTIATWPSSRKRLSGVFIPSATETSTIERIWLLKRALGRLEHSPIDSGGIRLGDFARIGIDEAADRHGLAGDRGDGVAGDRHPRSCARTPIASATGSNRPPKAAPSTAP